MGRVTKSYDEMTDRDVYMGSECFVNRGKQGSAKISLTVTCYFTDEKQVDTFWLLFRRHDTQWHWSRNSSGILLVDDERISFVGELAHAETYWSQSTSIWKSLDDSVLQVYEEVHAEFEPEVLRLLVKSSRRKVRVGEIDFDLPDELVSDAKEIADELTGIGEL